MNYRQMTRLFTNEYLLNNAVVITNPLDVNYLSNVMRKKSGDKFLAFNQQDGEYLVEITSLNNKKFTLKPIEKIRDYKQEPELNLIFAPIKNSRIDFLLEKATELGVSKLTPIRTKHTVVDKINLNKWHIYVKEAAEQCGRISIPEILAMQDLEKFISSWPEEKTILLCNEREINSSLAKNIGTETAIMIGPEGGFSEQELKLLLSKKFIKSVHLGERILRAETAVCYALSVIDAFRQIAP
jgi:16S rRNA (uracil1498-N3)-methyltransferase